MKTKRPIVIIIAVLLLILASLLFWGIIFAPIGDPTPGPPVVVYGSLILGVLGLVAAFGLWNLKRWGMWLSISISALSAFFGAGGIVYSSTFLTKGFGALLVAFYVLIVVCTILPSARQAYTSKHVDMA